MGLDVLRGEDPYDEENPDVIEVADYSGLRHCWICPSCGEANYEEEEDDPRYIGFIGSCECGWTGRIQ